MAPAESTVNGFDEKKAYAAQEEEGQKYVCNIES